MEVIFVKKQIGTRKEDRKKLIAVLKVAQALRSDKDSLEYIYNST